MNITQFRPNTRSSISCIKIKNAYNKKNPSNVIKSQSSNTIVNELSRKLQCEQEDCWLQQLNDTDRKNIDKEVFAPDHPDNWNTNPTEWLSNYDILRHYYNGFLFISLFFA